VKCRDSHAFDLHLNLVCKDVSVILVCGVPISSALVSSPLDTSALTVLTSWLLQSFGDSSFCLFGAASAIDMLWQHCVVDFVCIVLPLQLICFGSTVLLVCMSAIDMLWIILSSCFLPWLSGFDFHLLGFLIVLLLPLMGLKSVVVVLSICF
jgi:hypothetical protein